MAKTLGDRVGHFFTINEFNQVTAMGHQGEGPLNQVRHHAILAHGLAVLAIRAAGRARTKVGPAENMPHALPIVDSVES